jgi:lipopolysaccharide/colanic/teichoic acid biosynthesis glycosyltransferase
LTKKQKILKRLFDIFLSALGLIFFGWFIFLCALISYFLAGKNGFFKQERVGQNGKLFFIYKIRTIDNSPSKSFIVFSDFLRKNKIDELPQLLNVLEGSMSFVGPRPDIPGYADKLRGKERNILILKPGITGPATIFFRNEEELLNLQVDKEKYNREVIWPQKKLINLKYLEEYSFKKDIIYLYKTII